MQAATQLKTGQVNQATDDLQSSIQYLSDEVRYLEDRLSAVCVQKDGADPESTTAIAPARSELAETLNTTANRIHSLVSRLSSLRNSLDL